MDVFSLARQLNMVDENDVYNRFYGMGGEEIIADLDEMYPEYENGALAVAILNYLREED